MTAIPHPDNQNISIDCAVITISDTRTIDTDQSGQLIQQLLRSAGHQIVVYQILPDEPAQITELLTALSQNQQVQMVIFNGGTGIAPRDTTYDALASLLEKTLPGFGEIFRSLSYAEIGTRSIASRAVAGTYQNLLIFSLPGSRGAVQLGVSQLILPELNHLIRQLRGWSLSTGCGFCINLTRNSNSGVKLRTQRGRKESFDRFSPLCIESYSSPCTGQDKFLKLF